jgi:uncharacterized protein (DUF885 family)
MSLLKKYFYDSLKLNPSYKYYIGLTDRLSYYENEYSIEYMKNYDNHFNKYLKLYNNEKNKNTEDNILLKHELDEYLNIKNFSAKKNPPSQASEYNTKLNLIPLSSFHNDIVFFIEFMTTFYIIRDDTDVKNLNNIFINYIPVFDDYIRLMKIGIKENFVLSKFVCKIVIKQLKDLLNNKDYIIKIPQKFSNNKKYKEYKTTTIKLYKEKLENIIKFLEKEYLPKCSDKIGYSNLPNGKKMYQLLINNTLTTSEYSAKKIHNLGLKEVEDIKKEIIKIKNNLGHNDKTYIQFNEFMLNNKEYTYKDKKTMLKDFNKLRKYVKDEVTDKLFMKDVNLDYEIRVLPKQFEKGSALASYYPLTFYTAKNKRKGIFYLNAENMNDHKTYNTLTLSIHEASPGHHYQHAYPMMYKIPLYKNYIGNNTCYAEGWALYAETLYKYQDNDLSYYGYLIFRILRAARLAVDTGINNFNWSYDKAFNYMSKNIPITKQEISREIERYISIPTQAVSYYIGRQIFIDCFKIFQKKNKNINNKYSTEELYKKYHHIILKDGNIPMNILKDKIINYKLE